MRRFNLALRALMELGIVIAFGWWGWHAGLRGWSRGLLAIGVPLFGFGFWGLVDFRSAGRLAEPLRLGQELAVSGLAAWAWYAAGQAALGWSLAFVSAVHHGLVYLLGERLLKPSPRPATSKGVEPGR